MARMIDADALLNEIYRSKKVRKHVDLYVQFTHNMEHDHFMNLVINAPTVEMQPQWISVRDNPPKEAGYYLTYDGRGHYHTFWFHPTLQKAPFGISAYDLRFYEPIYWAKIPPTTKEMDINIEDDCDNDYGNYETIETVVKKSDM